MNKERVVGFRCTQEFKELLESKAKENNTDQTKYIISMVQNGVSKADLVSFGNYLLSDKRKDLYKALCNDDFNGLPIEERLKDVSHADLENWLNFKK